MFLCLACLLPSLSVLAIVVYVMTWMSFELYIMNKYYPEPVPIQTMLIIIDK